MTTTSGGLAFVVNGKIDGNTADGRADAGHGRADRRGAASQSEARARHRARHGLDGRMARRGSVDRARGRRGARARDPRGREGDARRSTATSSTNPKVRVTIGDAREYLLTSRGPLRPDLLGAVESRTAPASRASSRGLLRGRARRASRRAGSSCSGSSPTRWIPETVRAVYATLQTAFPDDRELVLARPRPDPRGERCRRSPTTPTSFARAWRRSRCAPRCPSPGRRKASRVFSPTTSRAPRSSRRCSRRRSGAAQHRRSQRHRVRLRPEPRKPGGVRPGQRAVARAGAQGGLAAALEGDRGLEPRQAPADLDDHRGRRRPARAARHDARRRSSSAAPRKRSWKATRSSPWTCGARSRGSRPGPSSLPSSRRRSRRRETRAPPATSGGSPSRARSTRRSSWRSFAGGRAASPNPPTSTRRPSRVTARTRGRSCRSSTGPSSSWRTWPAAIPRSRGRWTPRCRSPSRSCS